MYRVAKEILKREEDIEDKYFKTWLIRILINECNKIYNYNKRGVMEIAEDTYIVDESSNIDLYDGISKLSDELRVTTILYYFNDMSYKEIAKTLEVSEGTIEIKSIENKDNKTFVKTHSTGYQAMNRFKLVDKEVKKHYEPRYEENKKILGILDMEVTYVFNELDLDEEYYIEVYKDNGKHDFKILTDNIIKLPNE